MANFPKARAFDRSTPPTIATLTILAGVSAMVMNMFLPSLAVMAEHYDVPYSTIQLSVPLYLGVSALLQLLIGPISDKIGRRPVLLWGLVLFLIATLGCIYAPTATVFLIFRMMQASIAVCMVLSRAVVRDITDKKGAASMIGYVTMGMAMVPMIAPLVGGALDEAFGWHSVFWAFFAAGLATYILAWFDLGETGTPSGLTLTGQFRQYPELLTSPRFWGYSLASAFASGAFFAYLGGAPFVGKEIFGMSPFYLGLALGAPAVGYAIGNGLTGAYAARIGINNMVLWGSILTLIGMLISLTLFYIGLGSAWSFFGLMTFVGLGNGLVIPNATAGFLSVRPHLAGTASGLGAAIMIGGGALLAAVAGAMLSTKTGAYPLLWLQVATCFAGIFAIRVVIRREKQLQAQDS
jgi:DHA1 family bicyclomycin/chloramphenicol resistance-like MFS transporter